MKTPYFLWDYDVTQAQVREVLSGKNEVERRWMMGRILTHARFEDVWDYLKPTDIVREFPYLRLRSQIKEAWKYALTTWGYHV